MTILQTIVSKIFGGNEPKTVNVAAVLDDMARESDQTLNWRASVVDLMKLLGMESSRVARITLAGELAYAGNRENDEEMNLWLHREIMRRIADNGGKVPAALKRGTTKKKE